MNSNKKNQSLTDDEIDDILSKDLTEILGISDMPKEEKEKFLELAMKTIENRAYGKVLKEIERLGKLEEYKKAEDVEKFCEDLGINIDLIFAKEALLYKLQMRSYGKVIDDGLLAGASKDGGK